MLYVPKQSHPNACHAVGGPLTLFWNVEHGQAVGISLTSFLRWNATAIPHKLPALWNALGVNDLDEAVSRITRIMGRCGLRTKLSSHFTKIARILLNVLVESGKTRRRTDLNSRERSSSSIPPKASGHIRNHHSSSEATSTRRQGPSPNEQRSNAKNPNNSANQAASNNRANQMNPNNSAYRSSQGSGGRHR